MAAPRSTSIRALRGLAQQHSSVPASKSTLASMPPFRRSLHITGAHPAQPVAGGDLTSVYRSRKLSDLKQECDRRKLGSGGSKAELVDRLASHDHLQSRAFSIAMKRIDGQPFGNSSARSFNTSPANKSRNDSSPIDLAVIPQETLDPFAEGTPLPRMPILPDAYTHYDSGDNTATAAMKPQIYSVSEMGDDLQSASPLNDVVDTQSLDFNPFDLTERIRRATGQTASVGADRRDPGDNVVKQMWTGLVDDIFGSKPGQETKRK